MNARIEKVSFDTSRRSDLPYPATRPVKAYSIILIEDEAAMGQVTQLLLESCGYEVCVAANGAQGLRLVRALTPNLVICDVNMPGMDGIDVLRTLRQSEKTKDLPVIFMTGFISDEQRNDAVKLGVTDFLDKPCAFENLKRVIAAYRDSTGNRGDESDQPVALALSA